MTLFREVSTVDMIDANHEARAESPRIHFGLSSASEPCERLLWIRFRRAIKEKFPGRIKRLFRRGHLEEAQVVSDLRAIGCIVSHTGTDQMRVDFGAHVQGSLDGIIESGLPESPHKRHVLEIKTHSKASFDKLIADGVEISKPQHFWQMQAYMLGTGIDRAFYVAVCKNDDRLHTERVRLVARDTKALVKRSKRIALSVVMPEKISDAPSHASCYYCNAKDFCHHGGTMTRIERHCGTCEWALPTEAGEWHCRLHDASPPLRIILSGCDDYQKNETIRP